MDQLGEKVNLTLTVVNRGPSATPNATLNIFVPTSDAKNSYFLYLFNITTNEVSGGGSITCDNQLINPDNLLPSTGNARRAKRYVL